MKTRKEYCNDSEFEPLIKLLQAILNDSVINKKVVKILKMNPYPRHIVLSNWIEQLRRNDASQKLTHTLSLLFDDKIAMKILELINNQHTLNNEIEI